MNMLGSSGSLLPLKASVFEIVLKDDIPISDYKDGLSRICCSHRFSLLLFSFRCVGSRVMNLLADAFILHRQSLF
jgi:hypothetical protein